MKNHSTVIKKHLSGGVQKSEPGDLKRHMRLTNFIA